MSEKQRVDKWLWHARFFKTRTLATATVRSGHVRLNSVRISKSSVTVTPGDVLTFPKGDDIRVIQVDVIGTRRGPAPEAQGLYSDLEPPQPREKTFVPPNPSFEGKGRPTGRDRRKLDLSRKGHLE